MGTRLSETCPYIEICNIYKNWAKSSNSKDREIDIIEVRGNYFYECSARADLINKFEENSIVPDEIKKRLSDVHAPCSHITLLNLLNKKND